MHTFYDATGQSKLMPDEPSTPLEKILFLARAESRVAILDSLTEEGPATQRALRDRVDASRTTVSRAVQSLTDCGWVKHSDGTYQVTQAGRLVSTSFARLRDTVKRVSDLAEFFRWFPESVATPDLLGADDVSVTYSTAAEPYAPARTQTEILHSADHLHILLPAVELESTNVLAEEVTERGLTMESVVSPGLESTIESEAFAPPMRATVGAAGVDLFIAAEPPPLYLGIAANGRTQIGLADDDGLPRALLETTDDGVREWAEDLYRTYRDPARHKPVEEF